MSAAKLSSSKPASTLIAEESASSHADLRAKMERIERALAGDELRQAAYLLSDLIAQAREHFMTEESIAVGEGLTLNDGGRIQHDSFMERAGTLKTRCLNSPVNTDFNRNMATDLVVLLSDLVESDVRLEKSIGSATKHKQD